jgi:endonuclease G
MRWLIYVVILSLSQLSFAFDHNDVYSKAPGLVGKAREFLEEKTQPRPIALLERARQRGREIEGGGYLYVFKDFTTLYDCNSHPVWSAQIIGKDKGNVERTGVYSRFFSVDDRCAPTSAKPFRPISRNGETIKYHRGHLLSFNANDSSRRAAMSTNAMVNIVPQSETLNLGAYRYTELLEECYREKSNGLFVVAGAIDNVTTDNVQVGMDTPELIFKVVVNIGVLGNQSSYQAWLFPNDNTPTMDRANKYLISLNELESRVDWPLPSELVNMIPAEERKYRPKPWQLKILNRGKLICSGTRAHAS